MTRLVAVADLHGNLPAGLPGGDLLVIAGDVCPVEDHEVGFQRRWLEQRFYPWLETLPHPEVVWIAGNHDFVCERDDWEPGGRGHYLRDGAVTAAGLSLYGTPWVPNLPGWAFYADDAARAARVAAIPADVDVVVSHGPPHGYGDMLARGGRAGCRLLTARLEEVRPRLCVFGHIHEDHGRWELGETTLLNAAYVDIRYRVRPNAAHVIELES